MKRLKKIPLTLYFPIVLAILCIILPMVMKLDPLSMNPKLRLSPPSSDMLLGADEYGRDLLSRLVYGGRLSLSIAGAVTSICCIAGLFIGLYAALFEWADKILMRIMDGFMAIPAILMALALMAVFSASAGNVIFALVLVYTPGIARLVRAGALKIKEEDYMKALALAGQSKSRLILIHLLPNVMPSLLVQAVSIFADAIVSEAALSFLGAGIPAKQASWGNIIASGKLVVLKAPHIILLPSLLIFMLIWSLIKSGDILKRRMAAAVRVPEDDLLPASSDGKSRNPAYAAADDADEDSEICRENALLQIRSFTLSFPAREDNRAFTAVRNFSLDLLPGEVVALVGASGCGKSSLCQSILRLYEPHEASFSGHILYEGKDLTKLSSKQLSRIRGQEISMVFQDPHTALDPVHLIEHEFLELASDRRSASHEHLVRCLERVGIPDPERVLKSYPHELSGGLKQRVLIALALFNEPKLLLADEPTTALDVSVQHELMQLFRQLKAEGLSILFVTHDLSLLKDFADRVLVMREGRILENSPADSFFKAPSHPYSAELLASIPPLEAVHSVPETAPILRAESLSKSFKTRERKAFLTRLQELLQRSQHRLQAVDHVSFEVREGSCFALVGESGSGKTTSAAVLARLVWADSGKVLYEGHDLLSLPTEKQREIQMIFQNAQASFDPRQTMAEAFDEIERICGRAPERSRQLRILQKLHLAEESLSKRPSEFSGGQLRRLAIARALLLEPRFLILDESLSGLDLPVQRSIMDLLLRLQKDERLTYLLISHDLRAVAGLADTIGVMQQGKLLETQSAHGFFAGPKTAYAKELLNAVPK